MLISGANQLYIENWNLLHLLSLEVKIIIAQNFCKFNRYFSETNCFVVKITDLSINITKIHVKFTESGFFFKILIQQAIM